MESSELGVFTTTYIVPWAIDIALALAIFVFGRLVAKLVVRFVRGLLKRADTDQILIGFVCSIANVLLLLVIVIAALDQLGVDTTSMVALVGAAGLAVGLALQGSLQNFAAGVMLVIFRPFDRGDYVEIVGTSGVVEEINIFSTRLRTGDNRTVIVPNGPIFSGTITNNSARKTRRIDMVFGIGYDDDIKQAKHIITSLLKADERILEDPAPLVAVAELAESSVNFAVRPWVASGDYSGVLYDLNENIKLSFDAAGISIPYPQLDVHTDRAA